MILQWSYWGAKERRKFMYKFVHFSFHLQYCCQFKWGIITFLHTPTTTCPNPLKCHSQVGICWQIFHIFSSYGVIFEATSAINLETQYIYFFLFDLLGSDFEKSLEESLTSGRAYGAIYCQTMCISMLLLPTAHCFHGINLCSV